MKRFINFRPLLYIFVAFAGSVFAVSKIFIGDYVPLIFFALIFTTVLTLFIVSLFKKDFLSGFFLHFGINNLKIFCAVILISCTVACGLTTFSYFYNANRPLEKGTYLVTGKTREISQTDDGIEILIGDISVNGKKYGFNIEASASYATFGVGDNLSFNAKLTPISLKTKDGINTLILKTNIRYYCDIDFTTLQVESGKPMMFDGIKDKTKTILSNNMSPENAGFSYAVLCGDKSLVSEEYYSIFKNAGISHLLAVSGLHVGFLVGIVYFILKLFKLKNKYKFIVISVILFLYNLLCGFSPSIFRASVMSLCLLLGLVLGERNDTLSNISLAGIIVLFFQPLYIYDVGFLLSFGSVLGILMFTKPISKLFDKIKLPKILSQSFAVTLAAGIGTVPAICKYFGEFAPITIFSNLVIIPLFSLMYSVLMIMVGINLIVSLPFLITFAGYFVNIVTNVSALFAKIGTINTISFDTISTIVYFMILFFISPYFMLPAKSKLICFVSLVISFSTILLQHNFKTMVFDNTITTTKSASNAMLFTNVSGKTILANIDGGFYRYQTTKSMLKTFGVKNIDYLLLFNYTTSAQDYVAEVAKNYSVKKIYVFGEYETDVIIGLTNGVYSSDIVEFLAVNSLSLTDCDFSVECYINSEVKAVKYKNGSTTIMQIFTLLNKGEINNEEFFTGANVDYLIANTFYQRYYEISAKVYVCRKSSTTEFANLEVEYIDPYNLWTKNERYDKIKV